MTSRPMPSPGSNPILRALVAIVLSQWMLYRMSEELGARKFIDFDSALR